MADPHDALRDRPDDAVIGRYLSGTCTPAELARIERWLGSDPAHRAELAVLRMAWNPVPIADPDPDDRMWQWLAARMDEPAPRPAPRPAVVPRGETSHSYMRRLARIAAVIVLVIGGTLLLDLPGRVRRVGRNAPASEEYTTLRELITPRGARVTSNLPDGSRVVLGPDSRLSIPATFAAADSSGGVRDIYLQSGEAFFEVAHDQSRPFRVHTANGIVEDLGTEFVVTAYPETGATRVVVASGVVALRDGAAGNRDVTLRPGDLGHIAASGAKLLARHVDLPTYVGWTEGNLVFDETPLREAIARLGRWYDLDIQLTDTAMAGRRFTATFRDEPVSHALRALAVALDVGIEQSGRQVVLRSLHPLTVKRR